MLRRALFVAVVALGLTLTAHAQEGLSTGPDMNMIDKAMRIDENQRTDINRLHGEAAAALEAGNFAAAEIKLADLTGRTPTATDAYFMMGLAKTGLGKWAEARVWLERAVEQEPTRPEPRTRLGLAYAALENRDGARAQWAALAGLDAACAKTCPDAVWIADGLHLIDDALARGAAAARAAKAPVESAQGDIAAFDPSAYGIITFRDAKDLYDLLTQPGRCPVKEMAPPRQPCALILYRSADGSEDTAMTSNFKPVFKVISRNAIWAIHDKKLQKVRVDDLYYDNDNIIGGKRGKYISVAVIGNGENGINCEAGRGCLASLVSENMFTMYGSMPDSVVSTVWGEGMKDVGTIRVR